MGGAAEAFTFALFNIGVSFLIGAVGARELNHRNYFRKLFGLLSLLCYVVIALGLNLTLAHYREVAGSLVSDAGQEVLVRLRTNPLGIADVKSWLFFGIGILCSLIALGDAYLIFDPYPGYGLVEKRRAGAYDAYISRKNELIAALLEIRDEAIEVLDDANRDLAIRRSEYDAILDGRSRLLRLFEAHQKHLDRTANALLSTYREANMRSRSTLPPARFAMPYALDKIPVEHAPQPVAARDDLRHSIEQSQAVLADQVEAIHREFERAFASYREIDDLVEEKTIARSNARRRSRNAGDMRKHVLGGILAALSLGLLGLGAYLYLTTTRPPLLDHASLCPVDGPRSVTVVLLNFDRRNSGRRQARDQDDPLGHGGDTAGLRLAGP